MYGGIAAERSETNLAVGKTAGRILTWDGQPIVGYYSASSGGWTAAVSDVWPDKPQVPYLVPVRDPFDAISPYHRWTLVLTPRELAAKLKVSARDLRVMKNDSGRVVAVRVLGRSGATKDPVSDFREALGLRSSRFSIRVLSLDPPPGRAVYGKPLALKGFVRGLAGVVLEERTPAGSWRQVARVRGGRDGRFRAVVRPRYPTSYRLAVDGTPGPDGRGRRSRAGSRCARTAACWRGRCSRPRRCGSSGASAATGGRWRTCPSAPPASSGRGSSARAATAPSPVAAAT